VAAVQNGRIAEHVQFVQNGRIAAPCGCPSNFLHIFRHAVMSFARTPSNTPSSEEWWATLTDFQRGALVGIHQYHEFLLDDDFLELDEDENPEHDFLHKNMIRGDVKAWLDLIQHQDGEVLERLSDTLKKKRVPPTATSLVSDSWAKRCRHDTQSEHEQLLHLSPLDDEASTVVGQAEEESEEGNYLYTGKYFSGGEGTPFKPGLFCVDKEGSSSPSPVIGTMFHAASTNENPSCSSDIRLE
jgi:hypothetical protein